MPRIEMMEKMTKISSAGLFEYESELCKIGIKYAGTPGEVKAKDYILNKLNDFGLHDVRLEDFEYLNYMPTSAELEVLSPQRRSIGCEPLQYSSSDTIEGELVYSGDSNEELEALLKEGTDIEGKIVVAKTPFPFWTYPIAEKNGAAGFIVITDPPDDLIRVGVAVADRRKGTIPGATISLRDGQILLKSLKVRKIEVRLKSQGKFQKRTSWNIVGDMPGNEWPQEKVVVCSHYDSQIKGQHAWDNVSGDAGLLEIARGLIDIKPRQTIEFIFFGAEEQGAFWGSTSYVKAHQDEAKNCRALINLDGFSSSLCKQNFLETTPQAKDFALSIAKELAWPVHHAGYPMPLSDHIPFIEAGVPVIWIHEGLIDPYYHTEGDTIDHIDFEKLARITRVAGLCASRLAYTDKSPF
jgi:aminopeptidase YwaD